MNDGTRRTVVTTPFTTPTPADARRATMKPIQIGRPYLSGEDRTHATAGASAKTRPTARSISPQMSSMTSPAATRA
jgi:hypothetical protein